VASPGGLFAVPLACGTSCSPAWQAPDPAGHVAHPPAVSEGLVWDSSAHVLAAYPAQCGASGATCAPLVEGIRPTGADLSSGPAVSDGVVYVGSSDGALLAVPASCATDGSCEPLWLARTAGPIVATPLVDGDRVYAASSDGTLYAFPVACGTAGGTCSPSWTGETGGALKEPPTVAGDVVLVTSTDGRLYAFPRDCRTDGRACTPLVAEPVGALPQSPRVWAGRAVVTIAADGKLTAWSVDGERLDGVR